MAGSIGPDSGVAIVITARTGASGPKLCKMWSAATPPMLCPTSTALELCCCASMLVQSLPNCMCRCCVHGMGCDGCVRVACDVGVPGACRRGQRARCAGQEHTTRVWHCWADATADGATLLPETGPEDGSINEVLDLIHLTRTCSGLPALPGMKITGTVLVAGCGVPIKVCVSHAI